MEKNNTNLTTAELQLCELVGAKYITGNCGRCVDMVILWDRKPDEEIEPPSLETVRYIVGESGAKPIGMLSIDLFPSVHAYDCICVGRSK